MDDELFGSLVSHETYFHPFPNLNDMVSKRTQNSSPSCVVALSQSIANERPSDKMQLLSHKLLYQTLQIDLLIIIPIFDTIDVSASMRRQWVLSICPIQF